MSTGRARTDTYTMATDLDLLKRYVAESDARAFAQLAARHQDMVYATCYRVLGNGADAEDAAQDCFVKLASRAGRVRTSVAGWLHRVASRAATTMKDREMASRDREHVAAELAVASDDGGSWEEIKPHVDQAIDRLPDRLRIPLVLYYLDGLDQAATARELGISQPSVSRHLGRAVERVRKHLRKSGVLAGATALAGFLKTETSHAAPASLSAELGKLAVSGVGSGGPAVTSGAGAASALSFLGMWRVQVGAVMAIALIGGLAAYSYTAKRGSVPMEPTFVDRPAFAVMGVLNSGDPSALDYADIWGNQFASRAMEIGPVATERNAYGVYFATEQEGVVEMVAGMAVPIGTEAPEGLVVRDVPAATYAVVGCTMAEISETWQAIETEWMPASGYEVDLSAACFELFPPEATGAPDSPLTIYVGVVKKDG